MYKNNNSIAIKIILLLICLSGGIWLSGSVGRAADSAGRALFISSYSYAWDTVQIQIEGIREGLAQGVVLDYEFMDTKRVDDEESLRLFYEGLKYRLEHVPAYDVVILGDDAALKFAMDHQEDLFAGIPLVFEGVNDEELVAEAAANPMITGIIEKLSVEKNIQLGLAINPNAKRVVSILDDTITGEAERKRFYTYAEMFPELEFGEINTSVLSSENLRRAIQNVDKDTILIYVVMTEDASGKLYTNQESVQLLSQYARVPVIRMVEGGIGEGLLGGNVVSMRESGRIAAQTASDIIKGADVTGMNVVMDSPNIYYLDAEVLAKFNLPLPELSEEITTINEKPSFVERYRAVLIPGGILLGVLSGIIIVVCVDNLKRRKLLAQLEESRKLVETASQHDFLTGIGNRSKFISDLTELIEAERPCTVIMVDIDDFKNINDNMGHKAGDEALQQLGQRLKEMESQLLTPYRYAGDEFIMILRSSQKKIVEKTAYQCRQLFAAPFILNQNKTRIGGSIGISSYPEDTRDMEELIIFADRAMYRVKKNGKNDFAFYDKEKEKA